MKKADKGMCGACMWLHTPQGEAGLSCAERSGITGSSKACKDYAAEPFDIAYVKDPFFLKFKKRLLSKRFRIDPSLHAELSTYFIFSQNIREGGKPLRMVPACSYGPREAAYLITLFEKTQSLRDRTLSIKLGILSIYNELKALESVGRQYIYEHYNQHLQELKSDNVRNLAIDMLLAPLGVVLLKTSSILDTADAVFINLKDTYFTLKEIKDIAITFLQSTRMEK